METVFFSRAQSVQTIVADHQGFALGRLQLQVFLTVEVSPPCVGQTCVQASWIRFSPVSTVPAMKTTTLETIWTEQNCVPHNLLKLKTIYITLYNCAFHCCRCSACIFFSFTACLFHDFYVDRSALQFAFCRTSRRLPVWFKSQAWAIQLPRFGRFNQTIVYVFVFYVYFMFKIV